MQFGKGDCLRQGRSGKQLGRNEVDGNRHPSSSGQARPRRKVLSKMDGGDTNHPTSVFYHSIKTIIW